MLIEMGFRNTCLSILHHKHDCRGSLCLISGKKMLKMVFRNALLLVQSILSMLFSQVPGNGWGQLKTNSNHRQGKNIHGTSYPRSPGANSILIAFSFNFLIIIMYLTQGSPNLEPWTVRNRATQQEDKQKLKH